MVRDDFFHRLPHHGQRIFYTETHTAIFRHFNFHPLHLYFLGLFTLQQKACDEKNHCRAV
jgi:hypothetical protein